MKFPRLTARGRGSLPRLSPELDDSQLARVRRHLQAQAQVQQDNLADVVDHGAFTYPMEQLLRDTGADWDRRMHRIAVLAALDDSPLLARHWLRRQPDNPDAVVFHAWVAIVHGRLQGELSDPQAVLDACRLAAGLRPTDPAPWIAVLAVLRLLRADTTQVFAAWHQVEERDPWNREAHRQMLAYLSPEECGSHAQVMQFVDYVRNNLPPGAPATGLGLTASVQRHRRAADCGGIAALTADRHWWQPDERAHLDWAVADWCRPGFLDYAAALADLNLLAYALIKAARFDDAARAFQAAGPVVSAWPWDLDGDPVERFRHWQYRASR